MYGSRTDILFSPSGLGYVILVLCATLFATGVCLSLAYLGECAFVSRKYHAVLLAEKDVKLIFSPAPTITIKNTQTGNIFLGTHPYLEELNKEHGNMYEEVVKNNQ